ncbi:hypothetical protein [Segetibacter aerophilus]|uniref:DUF4397 domain-containing protein n=1 Tax=Segetibacter aerophilus TaxID=670293 RepID=A0A512BE51_9BACT|nr:hypothetical protein [Segetibacter aerophilus]GEO10240.1 hypothetical protein SAE01_27360 [Segetibacter aerophilus]
MKNTIRLLGLFIMNACLFSCSKNTIENNTTNSAGSQSIYTDSVFYVKGTADFFVSPAQPRAGTYFSFPDGLALNETTGVINVNKSDAGLKYRVSFVETGKKDTLTNFITISGINYLDGFYNLAKGDSILKPVYNADKNAAVPGINNGTTFDVDLALNSQGCKVNATSAEINLAQTVRNGVFGGTPSNNDRHEFEMTYRINDNSSLATNRLKVKLYFFNSMSEVTPEAFDIIASRQGTIIGPGNTTPAPLALKAAKPRPPCIFIVGR